MILTKQKWQDELIHTIGLLTMKEDWVIRRIVYHPLEFAKVKMIDEEEERAIRIRYFGTFVLKSRKSKDRSRKFSYIYRHWETFKDIVAEYGFPINDEEEFKSVLKHKFAGKRMRYIDDIYHKGLVLKQSI